MISEVSISGVQYFAPVVGPSLRAKPPVAPRVPDSIYIYIYFSLSLYIYIYIYTTYRSIYISGFMGEQKHVDFPECQGLSHQHTAPASIMSCLASSTLVSHDVASRRSINGVVSNGVVPKSQICKSGGRPSPEICIGSCCVLGCFAPFDTTRFDTTRFDTTRFVFTQASVRKGRCS